MNYQYSITFPFPPRSTLTNTLVTYNTYQNKINEMCKWLHEHHYDHWTYDGSGTFTFDNEKDYNWFLLKYS